MFIVLPHAGCYSKCPDSMFQFISNYSKKQKKTWSRIYCRTCRFYLEYYYKPTNTKKCPFTFDSCHFDKKSKII